MMDTFKLAALEISYRQQTRRLSFESAGLVRVINYGDLIWYIDVVGIGERDILAWFGQSEDIGVKLTAVAVNGITFKGEGYLHPNEPHQSAAIRGAGELIEL